MLLVLPTLEACSSLIRTDTAVPRVVFPDPGMLAMPMMMRSSGLLALSRSVARGLLLVCVLGRWEGNCMTCLERCG